MSKKVGWKKKALLGTALAAAALTDPVGGYGNIYKQMSYKIENAPCHDVNKIYRSAIQQHMKSDLGLNPSADSTEQFQRLHDAKAKALKRCGKKTNKQRVDEEDAEERAKLSAKRGASQKRDKEREESVKAQREETRKKESAKAKGERESAKAQGEKKPSSGEEDTKKRQAEADERSKRRFGTGSYDTNKGGIWGNVAKVVGAVGTIGAVAAGAKKIQEINAAQRLGISTNPLVWDEYDRQDIHEEIARHNDELEAARKERVRRGTPPAAAARKRLTGGRRKIPFRKIPFRKRYTKKRTRKRIKKRTRKRITRKTRRASPKRRKRRKRRTRKGGARRHN